MFIDDLHFTAKLTFSQERRLIRSVASDGLTNIYKDGLTKYDTKTAQLNKKNSFYV